MCIDRRVLVARVFVDRLISQGIEVGQCNILLWQAVVMLIVRLSSDMLSMRRGLNRLYGLYRP